MTIVYLLIKSNCGEKFENLIHGLSFLVHTLQQESVRPHNQVQNIWKFLGKKWALILYFSGGASNFRNYVGLKGNSIIVDFQQEKYQAFDSIIRLIKRMDLGYLLIFIIFTSFAVITRFIGIIGFYRNIKNTDTIIYLIAIVGVLIIFTAMYLYLGQSRFRVPLEPILMLLTVLAFNKKSDN